MAFEIQRLWRARTPLCAILLCCFSAWSTAQDAVDTQPETTESEDPEKASPEEASEDGSAPAPEEEVVRTPIPGDVVYFKVGKPMMGVQVLRSTPKVIEVETSPGVPPLQILRRLVDRVEYDDIDPLEQRRLREQQAASEESVVSGEQLAPELRSKLTVPLGQNLAPFKDQDLVVVLTELAQKTQVPLEFAEPVTAIPATERIWTVDSVEGLTFLSLLQEHLRAQFPQIRIEFHFDKVLLTIPPTAAGASPVPTTEGALVNPPSTTPPQP